MGSYDREAIITVLNEIEKNFEVDELIIMDLHIWPILRLYLFKEIHKKFNPENKTPGKKKSKKLRNILALILGAFFYLKLSFFKIKTSNIIFSASQNHYVSYKSKKINRFFFPLMKLIEKSNLKYQVIDYSPLDRQEFPIQNVVIFHQKFIFKNRIERNGVINIVEAIIEEFNGKTNSAIGKEKFYNKVIEVFNWSKIWEKIIIASKSKIHFGICYYNPPMYGLNLASVRTNTISVDMQHGTQGKLHAAYSGFSKIPNGGYNTLPQFFWTWDRNSFNELQQIFENVRWHKAFLGGNPWFDFLNETSEEITETKKIILFTLQPIDPIVPTIIIDAISKTPDDFIWWFRLHPRMSQKDILAINSLIKNQGWENKVEINNATQMPLPVVLKKSFVHISKYSGCIIEANMTGVPNIIIDQIGEVTFRDLIDEKTNFVKLNGNLWNLIFTILNNPIKQDVDFNNNLKLRWNQFLKPLIK